jgi:hypothetical protein
MHRSSLLWEAASLALKTAHCRLRVLLHLHEIGPPGAERNGLEELWGVCEGLQVALGHVDGVQDSVLARGPLGKESDEGLYMRYGESAHWRVRKRSYT